MPEGYYSSGPNPNLRRFIEEHAKPYDPAADDHGTAEAGYGVRGPARVGEEGGRAVTRRTWTLTGLAGRPVLRSLIVDGSDSWVVETATPDPAAEAVWVCETVLNG